MQIRTIVILRSVATGRDFTTNVNGMGTPVTNRSKRTRTITYFKGEYKTASRSWKGDRDDMMKRDESKTENWLMWQSGLHFR